MKKNIGILSTLFTVVLFMTVSCKKNIVDTADRVGISKVTYYANLTLKGDRYVSIVKGSAFVDSGALADEKGTSLEVKTSGTVDVNTAGLYNLTYTAVNSDGFPASVTRTVAVLPAAESAGVDLSGSYLYIGSTYTSTITKLAPGLYSTDNVWGSAPIGVLFICVDGKNIEIPNQSTGGYGDAFGSGTVTLTGALTYSVNLPAYGYSDIIRKWQKQ
jgi:hypothetical protein